MSKKHVSGGSLAFRFYSYCHFIKAEEAKTLHELEFTVWTCYYYYISVDHCEYRRTKKPLQPNRSIIYFFSKKKIKKNSAFLC